MPTQMGLLFLAAGLYCAVKTPDLLFGLLLFSAIFPASSAVTFGSLGIMPYYVVATLFVTSQLVRRHKSCNHSNFPGKTLLLTLGVFGVMSALLFPLVFSGVEVYSSRLGSSDEVFQTFPLVLNLGNVAQAGYLTMNILVVLAAASARKTANIWTALNLAFYVLTATIFTELACILGGISFPYYLIENSPDRDPLPITVQDIAARLRGTCGEPSYAGLILVIFFAAYFYLYYTGRGGGWKVSIAVVSIFLVRSSSAFVALAVIGVALVLLNPPFRLPAVLRVQRVIKLIPVVSAVIICLLSPIVLLLLQEGVLNKSATGSYSHRTTMDRYSLYLLTRTYGLGVGIGSFRPSSLIASLLGNVGIIGIVLAALFILQILLRVPPDKKWIQWALAAGLIDMALAIPDITQPILWSTVAVTVYVGTSMKAPASTVAPSPPGRGVNSCASTAAASDKVAHHINYF